MFLISGISIEYTGPIRKYTKYCVVFGDCDLNNIRYFYITDKEDYRIPGESMNINEIVNKLKDKDSFMADMLMGKEYITLKCHKKRMCCIFATLLRLFQLAPFISTNLPFFAKRRVLGISIVFLFTLSRILPLL